MGASPAASLAASLQTAWFSSGMFIVMTGERQATALLLQQRTGWLTGRPSGQGAKGMSLAASSPQERLHGFQLGLGLMGGQRGVSLGKQRTPGGGARGVKQAGFKPRHGWFTNSGSDTDRCAFDLEWRSFEKLVSITASRMRSFM